MSNATLMDVLEMADARLSPSVPEWLTGCHDTLTESAAVIVRLSASATETQARVDRSRRVVSETRRVLAIPRHAPPV